MRCGTPCPAVCGEEPPSFCALICVSECQCPVGTFLDKSSAACVEECPTGRYNNCHFAVFMNADLMYNTL